MAFVLLAGLQLGSLSASAQGPGQTTTPAAYTPEGRYDPYLIQTLSRQPLS